MTPAMRSSWVARRRSAASKIGSRRPVGTKSEFVTIMEFDSLDAVREFAGELKSRSLLQAGPCSRVSTCDPNTLGSA
jgi:hypothetical protein